MLGNAPERVLVVTGATVLGSRCWWIARWKEIGTAVSHVLFVSFDRLAPEVEQDETLAASQVPDAQKLSELNVDDALEKLCRFTNEVLTTGGIQTPPSRTPHGGQATGGSVLLKIWYGASLCW